MKKIQRLFRVNFSMLIVSLLVPGLFPVKTQAISVELRDVKPVENWGLENKNLEGLWVSDCHLQSDTQETTAEEYRIFTMKFSNNQITRTKKIYTDPDCKFEKESFESKGNYELTYRYQDGSYNIIYDFEDTVCFVSSCQEKILLIKDRIFISDFQYGESAQLLLSEPLIKRLSSSTQPKIILECRKIEDDFSGTFKIYFHDNKYFAQVNIGKAEKREDYLVKNLSKMNPLGVLGFASEEVFKINETIDPRKIELGKFDLWQFSKDEFSPYVALVRLKGKGINYDFLVKECLNFE